MNILKKEDLLSGTHLTVGKLKKFIEEHNLSDDAIVMIERVEDEYYEGVDISGMAGCQETEDGIFPPGSKADGWGVYLKEGWVYNDYLEFNKKIESGEFLDKEKYPDMNADFLKKLSEEELERLKTQYSPAWSCVGYKEKEFLFIDLHY